MSKWHLLYKQILDFLVPLSPEEERAQAIPREVLVEKMTVQTLTFKGATVTTLFDYKDPVMRQLIWLFKYKRNAHATSILAQLVVDFLTEELGDQYMFGEAEKPLLVPIPLSKKRKKERGFNHMELLAKEIKKLSTDMLEDGTHVLIKTKHTKNQTSLSRSKRIENVKNVFDVSDPEKVRGKTVLLIDDVVTTGSTLTGARKTLTRAKTHAITCIALAH